MYTDTSEDRARIADLRAAVDGAAARVRAATALYLVFWAYIVIAVSSVTDHQLLVGAQLQLPLLQTGVDLLNFFRLAPVLLLVLHANVVLYLYFMTRRLALLELQVKALSEPDDWHERALVPPFLLVEWAAGLPASRSVRTLLFALHLTVYFILPILGLHLVRVRFLRYQDTITSVMHLIILYIDTLFVVFLMSQLFPVGSDRAFDSKTRRPQRADGFLSRLQDLRSRFSANFRGFFQSNTVIVINCAIFVMWSLLAVLSVVHILLATEFRSAALGRLNVTERTLMHREPPASALAQAVAGAETEEEREEALARLYLDRALAEPLDLSARRLREADLRRVKLFGVRLEGADLRHAVLDEVVLRGGRLYDVQLEGARLVGADLRGATTCGWKASIEKDCAGQFQGAQLSQAQLQGADLRGADLRGADLREARLEGADLREARLDGANLREAQLQGANLSMAQLLGADLKGAKLEGAILNGARVRGADLRGAALYGVSTDAKTDLSRTDLRGADVPPLTREDQKRLRRTIESAVTDWKIRAHLLEGLDHVLRPDAPKWEPVPLPEERRADLLLIDGDVKDTGRNAAPELRLWLGDGVEAERFEKALADELFHLVCESKNRWIAHGIVTRMERNSLDGTPTLSFTTDLARRLLNGCPGVIAQTEPKLQESLKKLAQGLAQRP